MPYYENAKPKKVTREEHLRRDAARWEREENARKPRGTGRASARGEENTFSPSSRPAPRREEFSAPAKRRPASPRPEPARHAPSPAPQPAPMRRAPSPTPRPEPARHVPSPEPALPENLICGRNPIREAIKSGRDIEKLLVIKGDLSGSAREIVSMARERHIPVQIVEKQALDDVTRSHQGMLAYASAYQYADVDDMFAEAEARGEAPFLIILDGITDPMNLGAIIRTAACVGAHGVIVPEHRAVGLTPGAVKASAGAVECVKVARVGNLVRTIELLKSRGLWLYAADMDGEDYRRPSYGGPMALIIGAEGEGISRLVLEKSDFRIALPMKGPIGSLNASVAAGILMYEMRRSEQ